MTPGKIQSSPAREGCLFPRSFLLRAFFQKGGAGGTGSFQWTDVQACSIYLGHEEALSGKTAFAGAGFGGRGASEQQYIVTASARRENKASPSRRQFCPAFWRLAGHGRQVRRNLFSCARARCVCRVEFRHSPGNAGFFITAHKEVFPCAGI